MPTKFKAHDVMFSRMRMMLPKSSSSVRSISTEGLKQNLEIIGVGENIQKSPDLVYIIVDYDHFINASDATCQTDIQVIKKSCAFPRGVSVNHIKEGNDAIFEVETNFDIDDFVVDWQLVKIDKVVADITNNSLWYNDKTTSMLFRNVSSRTDIDEIFVKCQITRSDENQNVSTVVGVGFFSLGSYQFEHSDGTHGETESSTNGNTTGNYNHNAIQEYQLYIMFACAFLGPLIISLLTAMWLIRKRGKKHQSTCVMSVKQVTLISKNLPWFRNFYLSKGDKLSCTI